MNERKQTNKSRTWRIGKMTIKKLNIRKYKAFLKTYLDFWVSEKYRHFIMYSNNPCACC